VQTPLERDVRAVDEEGNEGMSPGLRQLFIRGESLNLRWCTLVPIEGADLTVVCACVDRGVERLGFGRSRQGPTGQTSFYSLSSARSCSMESAI